MIKIIDKTKCCGCGACFNICSKSAISMEYDSEGFLYPKVDDDKCVKCGLCLKVCPILHKPKTFYVLETYAAKHNSDDIKLKSSSGGMFTAFAEEILKKGGVVFGAAFNKDWKVVHTYVDNLQDLDKLRRSKYVQSDIDNTYRQVKCFLEQDRDVLFTGTPCQLAGLHNYLGKNYQNLLTAELICHGAPSPEAWNIFIKQNFDKNKISNINFRDKKFAWRTSFLNFYFFNGLSCVHGMKKTFAEKIFTKIPINKKVSFFYKNTFLKAFLSELIHRPICFACPFRGLERYADFTIGDLWGTWPNIITSHDYKMGMSVLIINSFKAQNLLKDLSISTMPIEFERIARINFPLLYSPKPHPKRTEFFERYKNENFNKLVKELLNIKPFWIGIWQRTYKYILKHIKYSQRL